MKHEHSHINLQYQATEKGHRIAFVYLNRPTVANAVSQQMIEELIIAFTTLNLEDDVRAIVLTGEGANFCAGADLEWMKSSIKLSESENYSSAKLLQKLFVTINGVAKPTAALIKGSVFGGAIGLVAACDVVFALGDTRFCLSEVKLGLIPATILPFLMRKIQPSSLQRWMLNAQVFSAQQACASGLVSEVFQNEDELNLGLKKEINCWLQNSSHALCETKRLYNQLQMQYEDGLVGLKIDTPQRIAEIRTSTQAQHGLTSFFSKIKPDWIDLLK